MPRAALALAARSHGVNQGACARSATACLAVSSKALLRRCTVALSRTARRFHAASGGSGAAPQTQHKAAARAQVPRHGKPLGAVQRWQRRQQRTARNALHVMAAYAASLMLHGCRQAGQESNASPQPELLQHARQARSRQRQDLKGAVSAERSVTSDATGKGCASTGGWNDLTLAQKGASSTTKATAPAHMDCWTQTHRRGSGTRGYDQW